MTRQWAPGDVAMVTRKDGSIEVVAIRSVGAGSGNPMWQAAGGYLVDSRVKSVRPLVVIDLPNGALGGWPVLVNALRAARMATGYHMIFDGLIEQIEAQTTDPKPAEPLGLGAVVEDANGVRWVRDAERHDCWFSAPANAVSRRQSWADTDAVRVLSEGIS